jgi:hypothetical protein
MNDPDVKEKLHLQAVDVIGDSPQAAHDVFKNDIAKYARIIKDANSKAE